MPKRSLIPSNAWVLAMGTFLGTQVDSHTKHLIEHIKEFSSKENLVELSGIEPLTSCMPCKRSPS